MKKIKRNRFYIIGGISLICLLQITCTVKNKIETNECISVEIVRPTDLPNSDLVIFKVVNVTDTLSKILLNKSFDSIMVCGKDERRCDHLSIIKNIGVDSILISVISYESTPIRDSIDLVKFSHEEYDNSYLKVYSINNDAVIIKNNKNKLVRTRFLTSNEINKILGYN